MLIKTPFLNIKISFVIIAVFAVIIITGSGSGYLICIAAAIAHETGHLAAMLICGKFPRMISISLFDVRIIEQDRHNASVSKDLLISSSGPLVNLLLFISFWSVWREFSIVNLTIGCFNLLPAASLDGGRILYLILSKFFSANKAAITIDIITIILSVPLFIGGILLLLNSEYNFSLLFISLYLVLSLFVKEDKYV